MIRNCVDNVTHNSTGDKVTVSLRDFPKKGGVTARVELVHFHHFKTWDLPCAPLQRGANISIKINTTKEFVTDLMNNQDHDMDKTEVMKEILLV
jgi:hypothetical protein